jgi:hypothetical protein
MKEEEVRECSQAEGNGLKERALYRFSVRRRDPIAKTSECGLMDTLLVPFVTGGGTFDRSGKISPFSCDGP